MNKDELIELIREQLNETALIRVCDLFNIDIKYPNNINDKYFYDIENDHYIYVKNSIYSREYEYEINKSIIVSEDDIMLCDYSVDDISLLKVEEITKERFMEEYNKILLKINEWIN